MARLVFGDLTPEQVQALDASKTFIQESGRKTQDLPIQQVKENVVVTMDDKANADHAEAMRRAIEKIRSEFGGR